MIDDNATNYLPYREWSWVPGNLSENNEATIHLRKAGQAIRAMKEAEN